MIRAAAVVSALALVFAPAAHASRYVTLESPRTMAFRPYDGKVDSLAAVRDAVLAAGRQRGWTLVEEASGKAMFEMRPDERHRLRVDVDYDVAGCHVVYVSSENFGEAAVGGVRRINASYHRWTSTLLRDIDERTRAL